jgi:hypothetical protein
MSAMIIFREISRALVDGEGSPRIKAGEFSLSPAPI